MSIIVADAKDRTDGSLRRLLDSTTCNLPIVLMSRTNGFKFNEGLKGLDAYVLAEVSEYGWDWSLTETHEWGSNTDQFPHFQDDEYKKFDDWVRSNPPKLTFQRELLKKDVTENRLPIDYPCWYEVPPQQDRDTFNRRLVLGFFFWGRSHEARLRLHSKMWIEASSRGFSLCDNPYFFEKFIEQESGDLMVSLWIPHYGRFPMEHILSRQEFSKISIALPGAGIKTFRHTESSYNSVMLKWKDELAWSYPWDGSNCILSSEGEEINDVFEAIRFSPLYEIYCNGVECCRKYQSDNYVSNYLNPILAKL